MKKLITMLTAMLLAGAYQVGAQTFWTENFESGSTGGALASAYTGPNGAWTVTSTGTNGTFGNVWYVSCAENGHTNGVCGTGCAPASTTATLATLHVSAASSIGGDVGAAYNAGPLLAETAFRAESPTINCTGKVGITLSFNYIENGDGTNDDATVWYYDGTAWALLVNTPKTPVTSCAPQGQWTRYTISLPASANNNASVKIGFNWVNNDDGIGSDPSFAVDSVALSAPVSSSPVAAITVSDTTVCSDSCITVTNTSTGTASVDSFKWSCIGATIATPTASPAIICFPTPGTSNVKLYLYDGGVIVDSANTSITVKRTPTPVIIKTGSTLSVSGSYTSFQWYNGLAPISGATNSSYTYTTPAIYGVVVDSNGCRGVGVRNTVGVNELTNDANSFWIDQQIVGSLVLHAAAPMVAATTVKLYDMTGREITVTQWQKGQHYLDLPMGHLPTGMYVVRIGEGYIPTVLRWIKE
jgi:hypothetical protein